MNSITKLFILFLILIVLGFLHRRYEDKLMREDKTDTSEAIQKYLLDERNNWLAKCKKDKSKMKLDIITITEKFIKENIILTKQFTISGCIVNTD